jgi:hypothetical protein
VEILRVDTSKFIHRDFADLEHHENITEFHLRCLRDLPVTEVLPILRRCTYLRRLTLKSGPRPFLSPFQEICRFIMKLEHLTFLHIIYPDIPYCDHFESLVVEVRAFVLPHRPNFKFYVSCCEMFDESRVNRTTIL